MSRTTAKATIIDTTGSFPITLLADVFKYRIIQSHTKRWSHTSIKLKRPVNPQVLERSLQDMLSRVAISRIFDIEGVCEVVGEIAGELRDMEKKRDPEMDGRQTPADEAVEKENDNVTKGKVALEIEDSEGEEDDLLEYLGTEEGEPEGPEVQNGCAEMIIVDDLTMPISGLFSQREKGAGESLWICLLIFQNLFYLHSLTTSLSTINVHNTSKLI
jgi:hypothetical protein